VPASPTQLVMLVMLIELMIALIKVWYHISTDISTV